MEKQQTWEICEKIMKLGITGNIVPHNWFKTILMETEKGKSKPDLLAINILSDVVYWYRPTEIRDEKTGYIINYKAKFKADMLQKSYKDYADFYGLSKRQIKRAIDNLVLLGLIKREFRKITIRNNNTILNNVMYICPVAETIENFTYNHPLLQKTVPPSYKNLYQGHEDFRNTNTEINNRDYQHKKNVINNNNMLFDKSKATDSVFDKSVINSESNKNLSKTEQNKFYNKSKEIMDYWNSKSNLISHREGSKVYNNSIQVLINLLEKDADSAIIKKSIEKYDRLWQNKDMLILSKQAIGHRVSLCDFLNGWNNYVKNKAKESKNPIKLKKDCWFIEIKDTDYRDLEFKFAKKLPKHNEKVYGELKKRFPRKLSLKEEQILMSGSIIAEKWIRENQNKFIGEITTLPELIDMMENSISEKKNTIWTPVIFTQGWFYDTVMKFGQRIGEIESTEC